jgi:hypothetical protein
MLKIVLTVEKVTAGTTLMVLLMIGVFLGKIQLTVEFRVV